MEIEEAIKTALQYENRVVTVYQDAVRSSNDPIGQRVFRTLVEEEKKHVEYLESRLKEWKMTGRVKVEGLNTLIPSRERIEEGVRTLKGKVVVAAREEEVRLLKKALDVEVETSRFYASVVKELPPEGQALFQRFVEIEEGHKAIVQAEMDSVSGLGFWFDMREFSMEGQ